MNPAQRPLRSKSDRNVALPQNDAMDQKLSPNDVSYFAARGHMGFPTPFVTLVGSVNAILALLASSETSIRCRTDEALVPTGVRCRAVSERMLVVYSAIIC